MHTQTISVDGSTAEPLDSIGPRPSRTADGAQPAPLAARLAAFAYGAVSYAIFFATFCYAAGFVMNLLAPKSIDSAPASPLWQALPVNLALLGLFAVQHTVMARPAFKRWWTRFVPQPIERSTYVLFSSLALIALFWAWQPVGGVIWDAQAPAARAALWAVGGAGWIIVLISTFLINHFDLFGLRQVWLYLRAKPYTPLKFDMPLFYKWVRHPLYVGWILAFWGTPTMTVAHLVFAVATTAYILVAIQFEERDLVREHGVDYAAYRKRVPMLIPIPRRNSNAA